MNNRQLDLSSIPKVINEETRQEFIRRLNEVYWDARKMNENFVHYGGKVASLLLFV
jgi:hypothetical protein